LPKRVYHKIQGNLEKITKEYTGDFRKIKNNVNTLIDANPFDKLRANGYIKFGAIPKDSIKTLQRKYNLYK